MQVLLFLFGLAALWVVAFYWLPAMVKMYALAVLHEARDSLYVALSNPRFAESTLGRDLEIVHSLTINLVRERSWADVFRVFMEEHRRLADQERVNSRSETYLRELRDAFGSEQAPEAVSVLRGFSQRQLALAATLLLGHPATILGAGATLVAFACVVAWVRVRASATTAEASLAIERMPARLAFA